MGKDVEQNDLEIEDESLIGDDEGSNSQDKVEEKAEPPKDLRGALKHAFKEVEEKEASEDAPEKDKEQKEDKTEKGKLDRKASDKQQVSEGDDSKLENKKEEDKVEIPPYWKNKGKSVWDKLSPEDKKVIAAREKEVSDGFAQYSPRLKAYEEIERVIAPRSQAIQQFGIPPAQVINRLFEWMEAISHPNQQLKVDSFKKLAQNFGVDVTKLIPQQNTQQENDESADLNTPPQWFSDQMGAMQGELVTVKQQMSNQQTQAAQAYVNTWANVTDSAGNKIRPHFEKVKALMGQLSTPRVNEYGQVIAPPVVPFKNGEVDLEAAYDAAVKLHPEVSSAIQQEMAQKVESDAKTKSEKDAKDRAERLARAKRAGSGLKPTSQTVIASNAKLNGKSKSGPASVRDSIKAAFQESRE